MAILAMDHDGRLCFQRDAGESVRHFIVCARRIFDKARKHGVVIEWAFQYPPLEFIDAWAFWPAVKRWMSMPRSQRDDRSFLEDFTTGSFCNSAKLGLQMKVKFWVSYQDGELVRHYARSDEIYSWPPQ